LYPGPGTNFGTIDARTNTWSDGYTAVERFKTQGSGSATATAGNLPSVRYLQFSALANCRIKVWYYAGTLGRDVFVSDGTSWSATEASDATNQILTANYVDGPNTMYIYTSGNIHLYKIEVSPASAVGVNTLSFKDNTSKVSTTIKSLDNRIYISNVQSSSDVNIYNITGALVKSVKTNSDMDFTFGSLLYLARGKMLEGQKSFKILLN